MREQTSGLVSPAIRRQSLVAREQTRHVPTHQPASRHYAGHSAGIHPEDAYDQDDEAIYLQRPPRAVVRHRPINTREQYAPDAVPKRRMHWLFYLGLLLLVMLAGWLAINTLGSLWQAKHDDWTYGSPRTYQTDVNVGHGTGQNPLSHFIAVNLHSQILVIELPGGDTSKARIYPITTLSAGADQTPVTLSFRDINADGKLDMLVQIGAGESAYTVFLFNNGSQFVSKL